LNLILPPDLDDPDERKLIGELLDACGFRGLDHVIDYGCGRGRWIWPLVERCKIVTGVDCEQSYLDTIATIAKMNDEKVQLINAMDLRSVADRSIDGIISISTLPIVRDGDLWHDFFEQAARVLRPGGRILFNTFSPAMTRHKMTSLEGLRYIQSNGWRFALDRQLGWIILWLLSSRGSIERGGRRHYATQAHAVERLFESKGFQIEYDPARLMRTTNVGLLPGYPNDPRVPEYHWWCVRKKEQQPHRD